MRDRNAASDLSALDAELHTKMQERKRILDEAYRLKAELERLRPEVDALQRRANYFAVEFKEKHDEALAAYEDGDGELAKEYSMEGRELQELCEAANEQTSEARSALREVQDAMRQHFNVAKQLEGELNELRRRLNGAQRQHEQERRNSETRRRIAQAVTLSGFSQADTSSIRGCLSMFPTAILQRLDRIVFTAQGAQGQHGRPITGRTRLFPGRKYFVEMFDHDPRLGERITETIAHELGHIAFPLLSIERRKEWMDLYAATDDTQFVSRYAIRDFEEDFCECLMLFRGKSRQSCKGK